MPLDPPIDLGLIAVFFFTQWILFSLEHVKVLLQKAEGNRKHCHKHKLNESWLLLPWYPKFQSQRDWNISFKLKHAKKGWFRVMVQDKVVTFKYWSPPESHVPFSNLSFTEWRHLRVGFVSFLFTVILDSITQVLTVSYLALQYKALEINHVWFSILKFLTKHSRKSLPLHKKGIWQRNFKWMRYFG